jgi:iron complex outermembrane receptor protein
MILLDLRGLCRAVAALFVATMAVCAGDALGQSARQTSRVLVELDPEDLMHIEVTLASKKEEKLLETPSAIYVITHEDIRRSGMSSLPDLLRMVPGLNVARIDSNKWAVSARGFNGRFANKLLVMIDGRSAYTPLFGGVNWFAQDVLLEDIERIEVIRGPGAAVWGSNAVNGVINIVTRKAADTQGWLLTAGAGGEDRGYGAVRFGGAAGQSAHYRFYGKYFLRGGVADAVGNDAAGRWDALRGGFRLDWDAAPRDSLTLQGDIYKGVADQTITEIASLAPPLNLTHHDRTRLSGGNLMARWTRTNSPESEFALQLYYDRNLRDDVQHGESLDTIDVAVQHRIRFNRRNEAVWGIEYRLISDKTDGEFFVSFNPKNRTNHLLSAFVQDEIELVPRRLSITAGAKIEHNGYTGLELQPDLRVLLMPTTASAAWVSVSRAVRLPARSNSGGFRANLTAIDLNGVPSVVSLLGNPHFRSETLLACEAGYRTAIGRRASLDVSAFFNSYDDLATIELAVPFFETTPAPSHLVLPLRFDNKAKANTHGVEALTKLSLAPWWKLSASYSFLSTSVRTDRDSTDPGTERAVENNSPRHQAVVRSQINLARGFEFDAQVFHVSRLNYFLAVEELIPAYTRVDLRLGWRPRDSVDFSIGIQNLLQDRHQEFGFAESVSPAQFRRSAFAKMTWRF